MTEIEAEAEILRQELLGDLSFEEYEMAVMVMQKLRQRLS